MAPSGGNPKPGFSCQGSHWSRPVDDHFVCQCLYDTLSGLCGGLSRFSRPSRAALIYAVDSRDPMRICDPQNLLAGHEPKFKELYLGADDWRRSLPAFGDGRADHLIHPEKNLDLAGLISFGARSRTVAYQMWFTEHHPDMCHVGPTQRWLEHAASRLSHDVANGGMLYTGISGEFLREYATHAVRDFIIDEMNMHLGWDTQIRVYPILDAVLGISRTPEEGAWARGELVFADPTVIGDMEFLIRFPMEERPLLQNHKHVRKLLLTVENSSRKLVSDGIRIVGVANSGLPNFCIVAEFRGHHGFLRINDTRICSFADGRFHSTTHQAKLVQVEEALLESDLDPADQTDLFKLVADLVHTAEEQKHGCTLVIDLNERPVTISGQGMTGTLDLREPKFLALAKSLARVDGALHIRWDCRLQGFACLLDGRSIPGEDRSRGARYNSALRFTAENRNLLVVVVSSDRPVSVIQAGVALSDQCALAPVSTCVISPPTLAEWVGTL